MVTEWASQPRVVKAFFIACVAFEVLALLATAVGAGTFMRNAMLVFGGFWPATLMGAPEAYPGQAVAMFATSAVLHGGPLHLFMNMIGLLWLGPRIVDRVSAAGFWPLAGLSAIGAGLVFTLLANERTPMIGASGVLFGFLGALGAWEVADRISRKQELRSLWEPALVFLALNVALALLSGGTIAWTAHLGGFLAGVLCGLLTWKPPYRSGV
ncbi:MAG: rhomboid family intramembrane serine protease [Paracoccaceae bacterium]|nr:rhomboid family intramembrane serine protease [Paracoccaceae bacterium]